MTVMSPTGVGILIINVQFQERLFTLRSMAVPLITLVMIVTCYIRMVLKNSFIHQKGKIGLSLV